jgi:hypothetical protein
LQGSSNFGSGALGGFYSFNTGSLTGSYNTAGTLAGNVSAMFKGNGTFTGTAHVTPASANASASGAAGSATAGSSCPLNAGSLMMLVPGC